MALVTNWVTRLSRRLRVYEATLIASYRTEDPAFELLIQSQGRMFRCTLDLREVTTLYGSIQNYLAKARNPQ
jgi:hypothetical protein